jgi:hypothetical protein
MLGLFAFPNLRSIFVAQQTLSRLAGLESCPGLEARSPRPHTRTTTNASPAKPFAQR